jgi:hypothetical protein
MGAGRPCYAAGGLAGGDSYLPGISADGKVVAFISQATNLTSDAYANTNQATDVFGTSITVTAVPTITWVYTQVTTNKSSGTVPLMIRRAGPTNFTSTVHLHIAYTEAFAGLEYNLVSEYTAITFLPGQTITSTPMMLSPVVFNFGAVKKVQLLLFDFGQAVVGDRDLLTVTIIDQLETYMPKVMR